MAVATVVVLLHGRRLPEWPCRCSSARAWPATGRWWCRPVSRPTCTSRSIRHTAAAVMFGLVLLAVMTTRWGCGAPDDRQPGGPQAEHARLQPLPPARAGAAVGHRPRSLLLRPDRAGLPAQPGLDPGPGHPGGVDLPTVSSRSPGPTSAGSGDATVDAASSIPTSSTTCRSSGWARPTPASCGSGCWPVPAPPPTRRRWHDRAVIGVEERAGHGFRIRHAVVGIVGGLVIGFTAGPVRAALVDEPVARSTSGTATVPGPLRRRAARPRPWASGTPAAPRCAPCPSLPCSPSSRPSASSPTPARTSCSPGHSPARWGLATSPASGLWRPTPSGSGSRRWAGGCPPRSTSSRSSRRPTCRTGPTRPPRPGGAGSRLSCAARSPLA